MSRERDIDVGTIGHLGYQDIHTAKRTIMGSGVAPQSIRLERVIIRLE